MKSTLLVFSLFAAAPLIAANSAKLVLIGTSISVEDAKATGGARAIVGDTRVSADAIAFDKEKNVLNCEGAAMIRVAGNVVTGRDCTIALPPGEKTLLFLRPGAALPAGEPVRFRMTNADISDLALFWEGAFGDTVTVSDSVRTKTVSIDLLAPSQDAFRKKLVLFLGRENGIYVIERTDGVVFDAQPDAKTK